MKVNKHKLNAGRPAGTYKHISPYTGKLCSVFVYNKEVTRKKVEAALNVAEIFKKEQKGYMEIKFRIEPSDFRILQSISNISDITIGELCRKIVKEFNQNTKQGFSLKELTKKEVE